MEAFDIVTYKNYREVGLEIINGEQLGTFNARLNVCQANLGLDSTMGFRHFQCRCLTFAPTQYWERDFHEDDKYEKFLGFTTFVVRL